jgi:acetyl esterase/lipase
MESLPLKKWRGFPLSLSKVSQLKMNRRLLFFTICCFFVTINSGFSADDHTNNILSGKKGGLEDMDWHITTHHTVKDMVDHPAFKGFGKYLLPRADNAGYYNTRLNNVTSLMPYHSHVRPKIVVAAINHMIDQVNNGSKIFFDFYTEQEKLENPTKASAGLFFFKGKPGAPFAILCPGGGFAYVGSLHEGFPHAVELNKKGYNAFVLKYRVGSGAQATQDLAAAISYIFKNAKIFDVSTENYSLWGSSAGARMVGDIAYSGSIGFGGYRFPEPRVVIIAYTGHTLFSEYYPPTFITVSENDPIVNVSVVEQRVKNLRNAGVDVEYHIYKNAGHGFGLGIGTSAEGWLMHAVKFWEKY